MKDNIQYFAFSAWANSLNLIFSTSIHLPTDFRILFLFTAE